MEEKELNEVAEQLVALAQTPEQVQYITSNNSAVLLAKMEEYKKLVRDQDNTYDKHRRIHEAKQEAYMEVILKLADARRQVNEYDW